MLQRTQQLFDEAAKNDETKELLERNPLEQRIVFQLREGDDILVTLTPGSAEVSVEANSTEYELFKTTVIELDEETFDQLLSGDYLSSHYLDGNLHIRGLPSIKILLGQIFRINRKAGGV